MNPNQRNNHDRSYISRDEFEVFERNDVAWKASMTRAIDGLAEKLDRMGSTDWKTFGMFAGLILSIVTLGASPFLRDLGRIERRQETRDAQMVQLREAIYANSLIIAERSRIIEKVEALEARVRDDRE